MQFTFEKLEQQEEEFERNKTALDLARDIRQLCEGKEDSVINIALGLLIDDRGIQQVRRTHSHGDVINVCIEVARDLTQQYKTFTRGQFVTNCEKRINGNTAGQYLSGKRLTRLGIVECVGYGRYRAI